MLRMKLCVHTSSRRDAIKIANALTFGTIVNALPVNRSELESELKCVLAAWSINDGRGFVKRRRQGQGKC